MDEQQVTEALVLLRQAVTERIVEAGKAGRHEEMSIIARGGLAAVDVLKVQLGVELPDDNASGE